MQNLLKTLMSGFKTLVDRKLSKSVSDWNQSDSSAYNYVKHRTHYDSRKTIIVNHTFNGDIASDTREKIDLGDGRYYIKFSNDVPALENFIGYTQNLYKSGELKEIMVPDDGSGFQQINADVCIICDAFMLVTKEVTENDNIITPGIWGLCIIDPDSGATFNYTSKISYLKETTGELKQLDPKYIPTDDILIQSNWIDKDNKSKAYILNKPPVIQNEDGEVCIGTLDDIENVTRVVTEKNFYDPKKHVVIADENNGYNYIVAMRDGNLVSYVETDYISITTPPTKTTYVNGEEFNPSGMVVIATAKDGSTREITNYKYDLVTLENGNDFLIRLEEGSKVLTARVNNLTVHDFSLEDFEYIANEDGTYELTAWKGTYNGEPSTRIVIPNSELIIV